MIKYQKKKILCADVAAEVVQAKMRCHVAAYENATWHTVYRAGVIRLCACVCVHVRVCD